MKKLDHNPICFLFSFFEGNEANLLTSVAAAPTLGAEGNDSLKSC